METVFRYDLGRPLGRAELTPEGYIRDEAIVSRAGIFQYRNADGSTRRELRHPDDVFRPDSLETLKMRPVTNGHPPGGEVNAQNAKALKVGFTGEGVRRAGDDIVAPIVITDADAVDAVMHGGRKSLSLGYKVQLLDEPGEYLGERYDARQTNIRYNHTALVDVARAGPRARLNLDAGDAVRVDDSEPSTWEIRMDQTNRLETVNLDGISYQAAPEVARALDRTGVRLAEHKARADKAEAERDAQKKRADETQAKLDTASEELKKAKEADHSKDIADGVKARIAVLDAAEQVLDAEEVKKLDDMSDADIRKAVILKRAPDAKLDDKSDDYLQARFDSIVETLETEKGDEGIAKQRQAVRGTNTDGDKEKPRTIEQARADFQDRLQSAWKPPQPDKAA